MFFQNLLLNYFLPIVFDSIMVLLLALFFLSIFRIKDPGIRVLFFFLPLLKPFLIIIERIDINKLYFQYYKSAVGLRFPDPQSFIKYGSGNSLPTILASDANYIIMLVVIVAIFVLLLIRWINLALFYRNLAYEEKVGRKDVPDIYGIIDDFTSRTGISGPDVSLTYKTYLSPFIVGLKKFTLVISPVLADALSESEKITVIQHELGHIKRKDNLIGWVALILRDLNFFNPAAYIAYYLIRSEQERACDRFVVEYSGRPANTIAKDILNSILKLKSLIRKPGPLIPAASSTFTLSAFFYHKRLANRIEAIISSSGKKIRIRLAPKVFMYILFIFLLLIQIVITFKSGSNIFILR